MVGKNEIGSLVLAHTKKMQKGKLTQKVGQVPKENLAQCHAVNILLKNFIEILVEILVEKQITNS